MSEPIPHTQTIVQKIDRNRIPLIPINCLCNKHYVLVLYFVSGFEYLGLLIAYICMILCIYLCIF